MVRAVQGFSADESVLFTGGVEAFIAVVAVLMAAMLGLFLWLLVRLRTAGRGGPGAADGAYRPGPAPSVHPAPSLAQRLQELDDLHRRGVITDAERTMTRHRALTS